jgi:tRNA G46 methylase TrmB
MINTSDVWKGSFGQEYTDRNDAQSSQREPVLRDILGKLNLKSALEVGCNKGHNLVAIKSIFPDIKLAGLEVNKYALDKAVEACPGARLVNGTADSFYWWCFNTY